MAKLKQKPFTVRFDPVILAMVKALSRYERRSINDEILFIIQSYLDDYEKLHPGADIEPTNEELVSSGAHILETDPDDE